MNKQLLYLFGFIISLVPLSQSVFADGGNSASILNPNYKITLNQPVENTVKINNSSLYSDNSRFINTDKLSDIITFEVAILAFFIPLATDMISRLSDRYDSESIVKSFDSEGIYKWLPLMLVLNISCVIVVKVLNVAINGFFMYIIVFMAVALNVWVLVLLNLIKKYLISPDYVKNKLFEAAEKAVR